MRTRRTPPQYRPDRPHRFVELSDSSWDPRRGELDNAVASHSKGSWLYQSEHPVARYQRGATRYLDVDDLAEQGWIDLTQNPEVWLLRPVRDAGDWAEIQRLCRLDRIEEAANQAFVLGVVALEGRGDSEMEALQAALKAEPRDADEVLVRAAEYALEAVESVGLAVIRLSRPLDETEKKRSGSQRSSGSQNPAPRPSCGTRTTASGTAGTTTSSAQQEGVPA